MHTKDNTASNASKWAALLNGRQYGHEMTRAEEVEAKRDGVLIVFGASDDLMELRGVYNDEASCYEGGDVFIGGAGVLEHDDEHCECEYCGFGAVKKAALKIQAKWDTEGYAWVYHTDVPHLTFDILEDGGNYCRGIVIDGADLRTKGGAA